MRAVLDALPRAEKVPAHTVLVAAPYAFFGRVRLAAEAHLGLILEEEFAADVTLTARFPVERVPGFQDALREMSNGTIEAEVIETDPATIMPLLPEA